MEKKKLSLQISTWYSSTKMVNASNVLEIVIFVQNKQKLGFMKIFLRTHTSSNNVQKKIYQFKQKP